MAPTLNIPPDNMLQGCLMGGAIGDAIGSRYEGQTTVLTIDFDTPGYITDDTQLTLATCESILETKSVSPAAIAAKMLDWYNKRKLTGLGSSTLKALRDLQVGAHWALSGRSGEYAAGNGAAIVERTRGVDTEPIAVRQAQASTPTPLLGGGVPERDRPDLRNVD